MEVWSNKRNGKKKQDNPFRPCYLLHRPKARSTVFFRQTRGTTSHITDPCWNALLSARLGHYGAFALVGVKRLGAQIEFMISVGYLKGKLLTATREEFASMASR